MPSVSYRVEFSPEIVARDVGAVIARTIQLAVLLAEQVAKDGAPRDTGTLGRSIVSDVQPMQARIYSPLVYAAVMEAGRRPGARMPPPAALAGWARRHGRDTSPGGLFVLARAIGRRGIAGRFFFRAAVQAVEAQLPSLLQRAIAELGQ